MSPDPDAPVDLTADQVPFDRWSAGPGRHVESRANEKETLGLAAPAPKRPAIELIDDAALMTLPGVEWAIQDLLARRSTAGLTGDTQAGKTTLAIDLCCAIASGKPFLSRPVLHSAPAVLIAGEGADVVADGIRAWKIDRGMPIDISIGVFVVRHAIQLLDERQLSDLIALLRPLAPQLVAFDTLSRCFVGGEENSAADMGRLVAGLDRVRDDLGATSLVLHHTPKTGNGPRGSGALEGALDTSWQLTRTDEALTLECRKQRSAAPFSPIDLRLVPTDDGTAQLVRLAFQVPRSEHRTPQQEKAWKALLSAFGPSGATSSEWESVAAIPLRTFHHVKKALLDRGDVRQSGARFMAVAGAECNEVQR